MANNQDILMAKPSVAVLLATYNGSNFLPEQIESLAQQQNVEITLFVSDDSSTDGTLTIVEELCQQYGIRCILLPNQNKFGSAAKNFYRLINDVDSSGFSYFSFADQDDIWHEDKLISSIRALEVGAEAVSSDVTAFWPDGTTRPVVKSQPQRRLDYLFESAGPGCTFVMSAHLFRQLQGLVKSHKDAFDRCALHDWAIYAVARALGYRWTIMPEPTMLYRQHDSNVVGARKGWRASMKRFDLMRNGWIYDQVQAVLDLVALCCPNADIGTIRLAVYEPSFRSRIRLCLLTRHLRRRFADRCVTMFLFASGLFWSRNGISRPKEGLR